jgi:hypothetical protein
MKTSLAAGLVVLLTLVARVPAADEAPKGPPMPKPEKEHTWLTQLAGEWESEAEILMEPGKPPVKCKGTETVRAIGGFWIVAESRMKMGEQAMTGILTLGYDTEKKKYVGTWVDSMTHYMWKYEGTLDEAGKVLTLSTRGPSPDGTGKMANFREVMELKDKDRKTFSSAVEGPDGKWTTFVTVTSRRVK